MEAIGIIVKAVPGLGIGGGALACAEELVASLDIRRFLFSPLFFNRLFGGKVTKGYTRDLKKHEEKVVLWHKHLLALWKNNREGYDKFMALSEEDQKKYLEDLMTPSELALG